MSYFRSITQNVVADPNNSSTDNLAVSASFTGTATSTLGVVGLQVSFKADQDCTVYVDQSPDGTNWDITDSFNAYVLRGGIGETVQAVNSYARVRVTNIGLATTTYLRLQLALCPIVEAVPRSLDSGGNFKVGVKSMEDEYGFEVENTPTGEMRTITPFRLAGSSFDGTTIDTNFWTITNTNGGTTTQAGQLILSTNTTANGATIAQSVKRARYSAGSANAFNTGLRLGDTGVANNVRRWGAFDGTDGAYYKLSGTTLYACTMKGGAETAVASSSWNGNRTVPTLTNFISWEIYYLPGKVIYSIGGSLKHTAVFPTTTWTDKLTLTNRMDNTNSGGITSNNIMYARGASISRLGNSSTAARYQYLGTNVTTVLKIGAGRLHNIVVSDNLGSITAYDNTAATGTVISTIDSSKVLGSMDFHVDFSNGLTFILSGGAKCTVIYE